MAICEMRLLKLAGINGEQDKLLTALHKTGAVELKKTETLFEGGERSFSDKSEINAKQDLLERAITTVSKMAVEMKKTLPEADGFSVEYDDFMNIASSADAINEYACNIVAYSDKLADIKAQIIALNTKIAEYQPYIGVKAAFSRFKATEKTQCKLGLLEEKNYNKLVNELAGENADNRLIALYCEAKWNKGRVVSVVYHTGVKEYAEKLFAANAFVCCPYSENNTAEQIICSLNDQIRDLNQEDAQLRLQIANAADKVRDMKILSDYYRYVKEKMIGADGFLNTKSVFVLEAYVPAEREAQVCEAIEKTTDYFCMEFIPLTENDYAPTLMQNKKVTKQFEFVTNLYSIPKYLSFDPNAVLGVFFSIFMGFINGDVGYGILMMVGGYLFAKKQKRDNSLKRLAMVMCYSGIFTLLFGLAFDSFLGIPLMRNMHLIEKPFLPDPISDMSVIAGISVPSLLLISLGMGVVHIMAGLFITALIHFQHGRIWDGICDGIVWDLFLLGLILLVIGLTGILPDITKPAAILMVASVAVGAITAGRHSKGFGKLSKGFSAVYGLINYMSDILSYARLYGLMLSGAQIASIVSNQLALPMMQSPGGVGGCLACILIMLAGHAFNIAMGLLGAFVHDARLQYVEFFSRFYEGDGSLFTPFGMKFDHLYLEEKKA